ncbi:class I SAM-dependent methyltransferase [Arhodomonas sp. AD133]|uniref:class I SAM-dependent methyltransferase n=1 Tax=Arhodomonas sp. AD133 TaxID=3415009 RepID=UPI003EBDA5A6
MPATSAMTMPACVHGVILDGDPPPDREWLPRELPRLSSPPTEGLYLHWDGAALALCRAGDRHSLHLTVDFLDAASRRRHARATVAREQLARACGLRRQAGRTIVDATAGLGRDTFLLATLGAHVTAVERSPVITALLGDGLRRAALAPETSPVVERITLITGDARSLPPALQPEVVYLDPMYQAAGRKALAGKEMQLLQALLGPDADADTLLAAALATAGERVVVKRHRHAPPLAGHRPHHCLEGRSTRFDVYVTS